MSEEPKPTEPVPVWLQQSPINIDTSRVLTTRFPPDYLKPSYPDTPITGHFDGKNFFFDAEHPTLQFDGKQCVLQRIHIHSRSEHRVDLTDHDFEVHLVHAITGADGGSKNLVIGVFFSEKSGKHAPESLRKLNEHLKGRSASPAVESGGAKTTVNPTHFLPRNTKNWFRYEGSLTTPPYTEAVSWIVMAEPIEVGTGELAELKQYALEHARALQCLNRRFVLRSQT